MADILLAGVNARFNHTNLAIRSISYYINKPQYVVFGEWTINEPVLKILRGITELHPKIIIFSAYIWNIDIIVKIMRELPKVNPGCVIGAGGPEAGYRPLQILAQEAALDFVITGEGEETTAEIVRLYESSGSKTGPFDVPLFIKNAGRIRGVYAKSRTNHTVSFGGFRPVLSDLSVLPFPYPQITDPDNRIYYYESSRGCPFTCAYCMSSLDKTVRFMPLERVYKDLQRFLDARVKLVKFIDRTYNLNPDRYIAVWRYILEHHNGCTMFHFEIEAEHLCEEALDFLQQVPPGIMQFEVGVQSSNTETLKAVQRSPDIPLLAAKVRRIPKTIHTHLDLIAGLPYENLESFGRSFDFTISLVPDALQLGFLKVLYGTSMESFCKKNGWQWMEDAPYEVLSTPYLSYTDIQFLKDIEVVLDAYYNSHGFDTVLPYLLKKRGGLWFFFCSIVNYCREKEVFCLPRKPLFWYELLYEYTTHAPEKEPLQELIRFDFLKTGKKGCFPGWCIHNYNKDAHRAALEQYIDFNSTRIAYSFSEYDVFSINPLDPDNSVPGKKYPVLFQYPETPSVAVKVILL